MQCVKHALDGSRRTWCRYDDKQSWHIKHFDTLHKCCLYCFRIIFLFFHFFIQLCFGLLPTSWFSCFFLTFNSSWLLTWWANYTTTTQQVTVCSVVANIGLKTPIVCHDYASSRPLYPTLKISYRYFPTSQCQKGRTRGSRLARKANLMQTLWTSVFRDCEKCDKLLERGFHLNGRWAGYWSYASWSEKHRCSHEEADCFVLSDSD